MKAYRTYQTIPESQQVVLVEVPFAPGQRVEILVLAQEVDDADDVNVEQLDDLFKATHALPQVQEISDEDIAAEIAAYRRGE